MYVFFLTFLTSNFYLKTKLTIKHLNKQEIRVRLPAETIFFAINLLQFFKIKFEKFEEIINISD